MGCNYTYHTPFKHSGDHLGPHHLQPKRFYCAALTIAWSSVCWHSSYEYHDPLQFLLLIFILRLCFTSSNHYLCIFLIQKLFPNDVAAKYFQSWIWNNISNFGSVVLWMLSIWTFESGIDVEVGVSKSHLNALLRLSSFLGVWPEVVPWSPALGLRGQWQQAVCVEHECSESCAHIRGTRGCSQGHCLVTPPAWPPSEWRGHCWSLHPLLEHSDWSALAVCGHWLPGLQLSLVQAL